MKGLVVVCKAWASGCVTVNVGVVIALRVYSGYG